MGAPEGNDNAKSKYGRTRVSVHLSVGNMPSNPLLERIVKHLENQHIEPTDQAVMRFVKDEAYKHLREVVSDVEIRKD